VSLANQVVVIDYGVGNLLSVQHSLEYCGAEVILTADHEKILTAKRAILPGVGAFANAMQSLKDLNLIETIQELAQRKIPLLGICLGMQLLFDESDEFGITVGLGLIPGRVIPVPNKDVFNKIQKIPHIGWTSLTHSNNLDCWKNTILQDNFEDESVYFVHSFMALPNDPSHRIADCFYGGHKIASVVRRDQITGCQFHPEKSGEAGLKVLRKFISL
jgi:glutamine amidotransferase